MRITLWSVIFLLIQCISSYSQDFQKMRLSKSEKADGAIAKYTSGKDAFSGGVLFLYKDGLFFLTRGTDVDHIYSKGCWERTKDTIVLASFFSKKSFR